MWPTSSVHFSIRLCNFPFFSPDCMHGYQRNSEVESHMCVALCKHKFSIQRQNQHGLCDIQYKLEYLA